jgi:uncharacterized membrane protein YedE/YeeE
VSHHQLPWFVAGPVLGLCVVAVRLLLNQRLGVTGGYTSLLASVRARSPALDWRALFFLGIIVGGLVFALVAGGPDFHGYGWLTQNFTGSSRWLVAPILLASGVLIGFGAKTAQGCTSGNGLGGTSLASPASLAATATFFSTAIAVSFLIKAVI